MGGEKLVAKRLDRCDLFDGERVGAALPERLGQCSLDFLEDLAPRREVGSSSFATAAMHERAPCSCHDFHGRVASWEVV